MASILFRMLNSFAGGARRLAHNASQFIARGIVPKKRGRIRGNFGHFSGQVSCCFYCSFLGGFSRQFS
ncbi:hypothetical protein [Bradyrhizobium sp. AZCC 2289]|uniref:hypothetical protein n=1 Tax=Bradyrhizobium sp. AZCC 2289 TaxID=3117026 RepID=UPI002FF08E0D